MALVIIKVTILLFSIICVSAMAFKLWKKPDEKISSLTKIKLFFSGVIAFIADTLGIGSFAVNVALAKLTGTFQDDELPAVNNGAQVIPGTIESLFFMQFISVDVKTLAILVLGTCIGGIMGGAIVSRLSKQSIRLTMVCCFFLLILLLISHKLHILPTGGEQEALYSWKLVIGFIGTIVCGALTSVGIGLFVMIQGLLFLLNVSPVVAFPIMTAAGALQQPLTTLVFLKHDKIPLKKTFILSLSGCFGVLLTMMVFTHLTITWLHSLLLCILIYNFISVGRVYWMSRHAKLANRFVPIAANTQ